MTVAAGVLSVLGAPVRVPARADKEHSMTRTRRRTLATATVAVMAMTALAACSGGGDDGADD
jgi:hypothetical protein